jgi:hypothetical protein
VHLSARTSTRSWPATTWAKYATVGETWLGWWPVAFEVDEVEDLFRPVPFRDVVFRIAVQEATGREASVPERPPETEGAP